MRIGGGKEGTEGGWRVGSEISIVVREAMRILTESWIIELLKLGDVA